MGLKATLAVIDNAEWDCEKCLSKHAGRKDAEEMTQKMRAVKGCETQMPVVIATIANNAGTQKLSFKRCPGNFYSPHAGDVLKLHGLFKAGHLPFAGSVTEQPGKILEAFNVIDAYNQDKADLARQKEEQKNNKRAAAMKAKSRGSRGR